MGENGWLSIPIIPGILIVREYNQGYPALLKHVPEAVMRRVSSSVRVSDITRLNLRELHDC